jgi:hypothetical protein
MEADVLSSLRTMVSLLEHGRIRSVSTQIPLLIAITACAGSTREGGGSATAQNTSDASMTLFNGRSQAQPATNPTLNDASVSYVDSAGAFTESYAESAHAIDPHACDEEGSDAGTIGGMSPLAERICKKLSAPPWLNVPSLPDISQLPDPAQLRARAEAGAASECLNYLKCQQAVYDLGNAKGSRVWESWLGAGPKKKRESRQAGRRVCLRLRADYATYADQCPQGAM